MRGAMVRPTYLAQGLVNPIPGYGTPTYLLQGQSCASRPRQYSGSPSHPHYNTPTRDSSSTNGKFPASRNAESASLNLHPAADGVTVQAWNVTTRARGGDYSHCLALSDSFILGKV